MRGEFVIPEDLRTTFPKLEGTLRDLPIEASPNRLLLRVAGKQLTQAQIEEMMRYEVSHDEEGSENYGFPTFEVNCVTTGDNIPLMYERYTCGKSDRLRFLNASVDQKGNPAFSVEYEGMGFILTILESSLSRTH